MEILRDPHFWIIMMLVILVFFGGFGYWGRRP